MEDVVYDDWQNEVLDYEGNICLCTGRQNGKTFIMSRKIAKEMLEKPGTKIIVASLTEDQAKLIIVMVTDFLEKNYKKFVAKGKNKPTQNKIVLTNKSSVIARPVGNTGDAIRGFTGNVLVLDEVSRFSELIMTAAKPTLFSTGGKIWLCSTPFGKKGYFWEAFQNKNNFFKVITTNSEEIAYNRPISESWTEKQRKETIEFLEREKKEMSTLQYGQEYLAQFLDDLQQFFSDEIINECCVLQPVENIDKNKKHYLGCDLARMGADESSYEIITDEGNDVYIHSFHKATTKTLLTEVEKNILEIANKWNARKVGIDAGAGAMGVSVLDHLLETNIRNKVVALNNRQVSLDSDGKRKQRLLKEDMYYNLLMMLQRKELRLIKHENIILSLKSVQYEYIVTANKMTRIRIFGDYTHIVEGIIRACWLARKEKSLNLWAY